MTENYIAGDHKAKIRKYLEEGKERKEIMELTGLSDRMVRNYIHDIHEQDKEVWKDQATESLTSRAIKIKKKYQELADICETIARDEKKSPRDRIEAGKTGIACENNIYNMLEKGPLRFNQLVKGELEKKLEE